MAIANDWLTDFGLTGKVDEDLIKRHASDRSHELFTPEQLIYAQALLHVQNNKADLPEGLHSIYLAACVSDRAKYVNRHQLVGYTQKVFGTDCDVEVNLLCPKCKDKSCKCDNAVIDIHVDDLYLRQHPWLWEMSSSHYIGYNAPTTDGFPTCSGDFQDFKLMTPRVSNDSLWNSEFYLGVCQSLGRANCPQYEIEPPHFITDLKEGQVLISFLKYPMDDEGYFMVPNYPIVVRAILAYITEKYMWKQWMKDDGNQNNRLRYIDAKNEANLLMGQAQSELEAISPDKFTSIANRHWLQDRGRFHYGRPR